jgi:hypothetical protein
MSWKPVKVQVLRASRTSDGAGGKVSTIALAVTGLYTAEKHKYRREGSWSREETTSGVRTEADFFFAFRRTPRPALKINDTLKEVGSGLQFTVLYTRAYDDRLEADVRRMQ